MKVFKSILLLFPFSLILSEVSYSQDTLQRSAQNNTQPNKHPLNPLPTLPAFPGGKDSLAAFIKAHLHYPKKARTHHISGIVEVYFTVATDGTIKNPKIPKPLGYGCDEEAIRIVHLMPKWIPSKKGREPMELYYHVDIPFGKQKINN